MDALFALDDSEIRAADLDGLVALYHVRSGMTHLVAEPVPQILAALADGPCDPATLEARLAATFDLEGGDGAATLRAHLGELAALGLVQRHAPAQAGAQGGDAPPLGPGLLPSQEHDMSPTPPDR